MLILLFSIVGLLSGIASRIFVASTGDVWITAGVVFGIAIGITARMLRTVNVLRLLLWVVASAISYYVAVFVTMTILTEPTFHSSFAEHGAFVVGGFVGAFLMLAAFHILIEKISLRFFVVLVCAGGFLGLTWFFTRDSNGIDRFSFDQFFWLYVFWQTGMALGLGVAISRQE